MFDDLRDVQPDEPGGSDPFFADDELLADLPGADEPASATPEFDEPMAPLFGDEAPAVPVRGERLVLGMTAQQRALLSVFLFLDVSVLGCLLLMAAGAISVP